MRKGYIYAIEGVIAALLIVFYLGNMVRPPERTRWDQSILNHQSNDMISAISRSGVLEDLIADGDMEKFPVIVSTVGGRLGHDMRSEGIPKSSIEVGIIRTEEDVMVATDESGSIGDAEFVIEEEAGQKTVEFDFQSVIDGTVTLGNYPIENSPVTSGDIFVGCFDSVMDAEDCDGIYQVGHLGDSLMVYDLTDLKNLVSVEQFNTPVMNFFMGFRGIGIEEEYITVSENDEVELYDGLETTYTVDETDESNGILTIDEETGPERSYREGDNLNIYDMSFEVDEIESNSATLEFTSSLNFDSIITKGNELEFLQERSEVFMDYLDDGGTILMVEDFDENFEEDGFMNRIGLFQQEYEVIDEGISQNVFEEGYGDPSGYISDFFGSTPVVVSHDRFYEDEAEINIGGETTEVERFNNYVMIDGESFYVDDSLMVGRNRFEVTDLEPHVQLEPEPNYFFENYLTDGNHVHGEEKVMKVERWEYNFTDEHIYSDYWSSTYADPEDHGLPEDECEQSEGSFELDGETVNFVLTPLDIQNTDCDEYNLINFDFTGDGNYNATVEQTDEGFSDEGPHTIGSYVIMEGREYWIRIFDEDDEIKLQLNEDSDVPTAVWNSEVNNGDGNVFYIGDGVVDDEKASILRSAILKSSLGDQDLVSTGDIGSPNVINAFPDSIYKNMYLPATFESVWWFR